MDALALFAIVFVAMLVSMLAFWYLEKD